MARNVQIDLPLLLPDLPDPRDACVNRLIALISPRPGIQKVHVRTDANPPEILPGCIEGRSPLQALTKMFYSQHRAYLGDSPEFSAKLGPTAKVGLGAG